MLGSLLGLLALASSGAADTSKACPTLPGIDLAGLYCTVSARGLVVAETQARADYLATLAEAGADRFAALFARPAARYAIVERANAGLSQTEQTALRTAGYGAVLPWLSPVVFRQQMTASVRRAFEARTAAMSAEQRELAWQAALAQLEGRVSDAAAAERDATAVPHELGHMWLIRSFWPNAGNEAKGHYGGPGPDWLDELAAVAHEPETAARQRRMQFGQRLEAIRTARAKGESVTDELLDIASYFADKHPVGGDPQALLSRTGGTSSGGATIRVLTGTEAQRVAGDGIRFYLQSRLVADYLVEKTGDKAIFGKLAAAMARNPDFAAWLNDAGPKHKLPRSIAALAEDWRGWLDQKYPKPAS